MGHKHDSKRDYLLTIINDILDEKEEANTISQLSNDASLTEDLGLESLELAEMTVRLEDMYGVDVFEDDVVDEVGEVLRKLDS